jgi:hypothetical protein
MTTSRNQTVKRSVSAVGLSLWLVLSTPQAALAYLDPGTGSVILQGMIALVGVMLTTALMYWRSVKRRLYGVVDMLKRCVSRKHAGQ